MIRLRGLYALLDAQGHSTARLLEYAEAALASGIALLQYRDKTATHGIRTERAQALQSLAVRHGVPLLVNDDVSAARQAGAAGVHLGQQDMHADEARQILGADAMIGVTCHDDIRLARVAVAQGASYVAFGRFFPSATKPEAPPASLDVLRSARRTLPCPVAAIGGITPERTRQVLEAGADLVVVSGALFGAASAEEVCRRARVFVSEIESWFGEVS